MAHYNDISGNHHYGINAEYNEDQAINATHNWWNHGSGPFHDTANENGTGDNITIFVEYYPWLEQSIGESGEVDDDDDGGWFTWSHVINDIIDTCCLCNEIMILSFVGFIMVVRKKEIAPIMK